MIYAKIVSKLGDLTVIREAEFFQMRQTAIRYLNDKKKNNLLIVTL